MMGLELDAMSPQKHVRQALEYLNMDITYVVNGQCVVVLCLSGAN